MIQFGGSLIDIIELIEIPVDATDLSEGILYALRYSTHRSANPITWSYPAMMSISKTAEHLSISKPTLYRLMKDHDIETHPHGVRKMISDEDISKLESLIGSKSTQQSFLNGTDDLSSNGVKVSTGQDSYYLKQLLADKDDQIKHLKEQLSKAQDTKDELYQGLMGIQQQMGSMRLMLEEPRKPFWSRLFG